MRHATLPVAAGVARVPVAVIGFGRLGQACAHALLDDPALALAGVVRHVAPGQAPATLPGRLQGWPAVAHVSELGRLGAALVCVPAGAVLGVARELLQAHIPVVECAMFEGPALQAHHAALDDAAQHHRQRAVVAAGWDPGVLPLLRQAFDMLIPQGRTQLHRHPGLRLHHSAAVAEVPGVKQALVGDYRDGQGGTQHYVYAELAPGVPLAQVQGALAADPLFAGEQVQVFEVARLDALEGENGHGVVLERRSSSVHGPHQSLLLESRFDPVLMAARAMLDAVHSLPAQRPGAQPYALRLRP